MNDRRPRLFHMDKTLADQALPNKLREWVDHLSWADASGDHDENDDRDKVECRRLLTIATWSSTPESATHPAVADAESAFSSTEVTSRVAVASSFPAGIAAELTTDQQTADQQTADQQTADFEERGDLNGDLHASRDLTSASVHAGRKATQRFKLEEVIGQGGFGIVFRAYDYRLDRQVAVKILRPSATRRLNVFRRFLREAKAVQALNHAGILAIYDVGSVEGHPFIVTELVDGPNMAKWLTDTKQLLPIRRVVQVMREIAESVHYAHSRGILHRDLKPSNVLLQISEADDGELNIKTKLSDFGLAKQIDGAIDSVHSLTHVREMVGTLGYMSPEQVRGKSTEVTITSDVFSLGVMLYELSTGVTPFHGSSDVDTLHRICHATPVRPRQRNRLIPRDLEAITMHCLEKTPEKRYATAAALVADLDCYLQGLPVEASNPSPLRRLWAGLRAHPYRTAAAGLMLVVTLAFVSYTQTVAARERLQQQRADQNLRLAMQGMGKTLNSLSEQINAGTPISHEMHLKILDTSRQVHQQLTALNTHDTYALYRLSVAHHYVANGLARVGKHGLAVAERRKALSILERLLQREPRNVEYHFDTFMQNYLMAGEVTRSAADTLHPDAESAWLCARESIQRVLILAPENVDYQDASNAFNYSDAFRHPRGKAKRMFEDVAARSMDLYRLHPDRPHLLKPYIRAYASLANRANEEKNYLQAIEHAKAGLTLIDQIFPESQRERTIWFYHAESSAELTNGLAGIADWVAADSAAEDTLRSAAMASTHDVVPSEVLARVWQIRAEANEQLGKTEVAAQCADELRRLTEAE